ncbi:hypothetical protein GCK72_013422 [Caenorhabditis remanei]|uniref:Uncharacterized protein n=1 Tax=Caenorhabditis remanei TaxID=31234 RepID=A0A6A5GP43_CAERE|nr:hypothetical protein GCK72_013422 [Caenorhabditis remanei]KAF1756967.1 hypothetical protein GCK72_013422 [Caenorhabditis remanei]
MRENRQQVFFVEFADAIRPVLKNTVVYLTGGFRTVGAMVDAVQRNTTQRIGLGRPVTAVPDLPKKSVNGSVPSAKILASRSQLEQMGRKSTFNFLLWSFIESKFKDALDSSKKPNIYPPVHY